MIVSPVLGSRAIFDQLLQGSPIAGPLATADVLVVVVTVLGRLLVGARGGIRSGGDGRALRDEGVGTGAFGAGARCE
jgi:hypothetical protein